MEPTTTHGGDSPPFWPPSTTRSHRRNPSSPFLNPAFVFVILPLIFFLLTFFLVPTFFSRNSQIAKPNNTRGTSVKKTWDLFNVILVLFAVLCGIFANKTANDDDVISSISTDSTATGVSDDAGNMNLMKSGEQFGGVSSSNQWFDGSGGDDNRNHHHHHFFSRVPERNHHVAVVNQLRTMNGGSAFSDLRHEQVIPMNGPAGKHGSDERFKFYDDFDINRYRALGMNDDNVVPVHRRRRSMGELSEFKSVPVDKFVVPDAHSTEAPTPPFDSAGDGVAVTENVPPPSPPARKPRKTTYRQSVSRKADAQKRARSPPPVAAISTQPPPSISPPQSPPPSAPPAPSPEVVNLPPPELEDVRLEKKKKSANATKEIKTVLASIYNPVKRKKKHKTKEVIIDDSLRAERDLPVDSSPPSMQPPLPPPPPPSVFKLFKKSSKNKKIHSVPPPPAPPLPRHHHRQNTPLPLPISQPEPQSQPKPQQRAGLSQRTRSTTAGRPPLPNKIISFSNNNADNESLANNSGNQSPLLPMPPPPPVPPFQMSAMKFTLTGDYVCIKSGPSTRCSSPELDSSLSSNVMDSGNVIAQPSSAFCPSPDVNMKADTFIARLRDEWKNDKINSMKGKQKLGRVPGSIPIN